MCIEGCMGCIDVKFQSLLIMTSHDHEKLNQNKAVREKVQNIHFEHIGLHIEIHVRCLRYTSDGSMSTWYLLIALSIMVSGVS